MGSVGVSGRLRKGGALLLGSRGESSELENNPCSRGLHSELHLSQVSASFGEIPAPGQRTHDGGSFDPGVRVRLPPLSVSVPDTRCSAT